MSLSGTQKKTLRLALLDAFRTHRALKDMLREELDRNLDEVALGDDLSEIVSKLIDKADAYNWLRALIDGAHAANPNNEQLARARQELLAVLPAAAPTKVAGAKGLEQIIREKSPFLHVDVLVDFLERAKRRVCRIERLDETPLGTGFLVGPEVVLTNHHVIDEFDPHESPGFQLRFDYITGPDGRSTTGGKVERVAPQDWLLASAPPSPFDFDGEPDPDPSHLDFALIQTRDVPGNELIRDSIRGWVELPRNPSLPASDDVLMVIQHPGGQPLQITIDTALSVNANQTRVRYRPNTLGGSSGSPCFDLNRQLVALHHGHGELRFKYNEGIPAASLRRYFDLKGYSRFLGGPLATPVPTDTTTASAKPDVPAIPNVASVTKTAAPSGTESLERSAPAPRHAVAPGNAATPGNATMPGNAAAPGNAGAPSNAGAPGNAGALAAEPLSVTPVNVELLLVFSDKDQALLEELEIHLDPFLRANNVELWHAGMAEAGADVLSETSLRVERAPVIAVLLSAAMLASRPQRPLLERAMKRRDEGTASVVPVLVKPAVLGGTRFDGLASLPRNGKPVNEWGSRDAAWVEVVEGIRSVVLGRRAKS